MGRQVHQHSLDDSQLIHSGSELQRLNGVLEGGHLVLGAFDCILLEFSDNFVTLGLHEVAHLVEFVVFRLLCFLLITLLLDNLIQLLREVLGKKDLHPFVLFHLVQALPNIVKVLSVDFLFRLDVCLEVFLHEGLNLCPNAVARVRIVNLQVGEVRLNLNVVNRDVLIHTANESYSLNRHLVSSDSVVDYCTRVNIRSVVKLESVHELIDKSTLTEHLRH